MGGTKIKTIDDSVTEEPKKKGKKSEKSVTASEISLESDNSEAQMKSDEIGKSEDGESVKKVTDTAEAPKKKEAKVSKRAAKKGKEKYRSKQYKSAVGDFDKSQKLPLTEAIEMAKKVSYTKFPSTMEAHINTNVKNIRGITSLPFTSGRKLTIVAFGKDADKSGADIVGSEETIAEIQKGKINFDVVVTTPEWMPKLAVVAKFLGPRGLMPNPKSGTITDNLAKAVEELQAGKIEYKTEKDGQVIHISIGKIDQASEEIAANIKALYMIIGKSKIKKITLAPTMGVGVKVQLNSI